MKPIQVVQKVHTRYVPGTNKTSDKDPDETSYAEQISVDKRHYCTHCKRKRDERFMVVAGWGAFGKKKWRCDDDVKACTAIRKIKRGW